MNRTSLTELLILIRGDRNSGKSALYARMRGKPFNEQYNPSAVSQNTTISWRPRNSGSSVSLHLVDVFSPSARLSSSAFGRPDALVLLYDPRNINSVDHLLGIIDSTPEYVPIALLLNFQDVILADPHPRLMTKANRFKLISCSLKTNLGLKELNEWLNYPYLKHLCRMYKKLEEESNAQVQRIQSMFTPGGIHIGITTKQPEIREDSDNGDGFWSDDDIEQPKVHLRRSHAKKGESTKPEVIPRQRRQMIGKEDRDLLSGIVEAAISQRPPKEEPQVVPLIGPMGERMGSSGESETVESFRRRRHHREHHRHHRSQPPPHPTTVGDYTPM